MTFLSVYNAWVRYAEKQDSAQLLRKLQKNSEDIQNIAENKAWQNTITGYEMPHTDKLIRDTMPGQDICFP